MIRAANTDYSPAAMLDPDAANELNDKSTMNKIMEYMALGKPIVQFDLTEGRLSAQEVSLYARPNDIVDLAERIIELLDDPEHRTQMGDFGRRRVVDWSMSAAMIAQLVIDALMMAVWCHGRAKELLHHSARASQYSKRGLPAPARRTMHRL